MIPEKSRVGGRAARCDIRRSACELKRQQAEREHGTANDAQVFRFELAHLFRHALPCVWRREQKQPLEHQHQTQRGEERMFHVRYGLPPEALLSSK